MYDWAEVLDEAGANRKAVAYQRVLNEAINKCFPLKSRKKKSTDLPWMTDGIRHQIKLRKELFVAEEGVSRTAAWKEEKRKTAHIIRKS